MIVESVSKMRTRTSVFEGIRDCSFVTEKTRSTINQTIFPSRNYEKQQQTQTFSTYLSIVKQTKRQFSASKWGNYSRVHLKSIEF